MALHWLAPTAILLRAKRDALYPVDDSEPMMASFSHYNVFVYALAVVREVTLDGNTSYDLCKVGKKPNPAMETTTPSVQDSNLGYQAQIYAWLDMSKYWQYEPLSDCLRLRLPGWRPKDSRYQAIPGWLRRAQGAELFASAVRPKPRPTSSKSGSLKTLPSGPKSQPSQSCGSYSGVGTSAVSLQFTGSRPVPGPHACCRLSRCVIPP